MSYYTTFKVVVRNADVIENGTNVTVKTPHVIVNGTEKAENVIENDGNVIEKSRREYILDLMRKDKRISVKQLSKQLNVTTRTIFREIDTLKSEGKIKRIGSDKSGTWEIID